MPIHDWTRVPSGLFHHFHQDWTVEIARGLNRGLLPPGYYALVEQRVDGPEPDVIAAELKGAFPASVGPAVGLLESPTTRRIARVASDAARYAARANRIVVRHPLGDVVALIEVVSPGNKDSRSSLRAFVDKAVTSLRSGVHLLIIDLFPPSGRDPGGIHQAIWDEFSNEAPEAPGKPLTLVAYQAAGDLTAYIEPAAVGDAMPAMPLYLTADRFVNVPLEPSCDAAWENGPAPVRSLVVGA